VILERDRLVSRALQLLLSSAGFVVLGAATSAQDALGVIQHGFPGLLLATADSPGMPLASLVGLVRELRPDLPVAVLLTISDPELITLALVAGATGVLSRYADPALLPARLVAATRGLVFDEVTSKALHMTATASTVVLTEREMQVLTEVSLGHKLSTAARVIGVSESTAKSHAAKAAGKLGVRSVQAAAARALFLGLLPDRQ
jgi:DNA-binding NarL/FixJ family response regulator